jgi:hypothetical protein
MLKADSFTISVKVDTAANLEGQTLTRGAVQVPTGAQLAEVG